MDAVPSSRNLPVGPLFGRRVQQPRKLGERGGNGPAIGQVDDHAIIGAMHVRHAFTLRRHG